eukprot:10150338-Alexandrium_andersonii.AAC.1
MVAAAYPSRRFGVVGRAAIRTATRQRASSRSASGGARPRARPPGMRRRPSKGAPRTTGWAVTCGLRSGSPKSAR